MNLTPTPKMTATGIVGAFTVILFWALHQYGHLDLPPEVASSITLCLSWLAGYIAPKSTQ